MRKTSTKQTPKVEPILPKTAEIIPIYRPGDHIMVAINMNMEFVVNGVEIVDGEMNIKASPDSEWSYNFSAGCIRHRAAKVSDEEIEAAS